MFFVSPFVTFVVKVFYHKEHEAQSQSSLRKIKKNLLSFRASLLNFPSFICKI